MEEKNPLDGTYSVTSTGTYDGPLRARSDGVTVIRNGATSRTDANGVKWSSRFTVLNEAEVEMVSVADPREARRDFALMRPDGSPSLEPVTYHTVLRLSRKGERIQMSGKIDYAGEVVLLTLQRTGG